MDCDSDFSSEHMEKPWGKQEGGEYVTDGFVYRGKRSFDKVLGDLKETLLKGFQRSINGVEFRVLDASTKWVELEIEIEIVENKNKGIAILKSYGPNKKKESVVTVSRGKGSDPKFVIILAQKILKPLMNEILRGNLKKEESRENGTKNAITVKGEKVNLHKCPHCEKTSYSMPGLKGHITKMHHGVVKKTEILKPENEV